MKKTHPYLWLLLIPLAVLLVAGIFYAGAALDVSMADRSENIGHAAPAFTILAFPVSIIVFVVLTIISIVKTIKGVKNKKAEENRNGKASSYQEAQDK